MFKRIILGLMLVLLVCNTGWADFLGIKQSSETISFFVNSPLDSLYGIQRKPDSVHIFTYADDATAFTYAARSTTYPFSDVSMDTLKHFTDTMYVFKDAISDIDGAGGHSVLAINVQMYYDKTPTHTYATVQVISDSLENMLDASKDSSSSAAVISQEILDTLQLYDAAGHLQVTVSAMDAGVITATVMATNSIGADEVADNAIDAGAIAAAAIGASEMATDAIGAAEIAAAAITVSEMASIAYFDSLIYRGPKGPGIWIDEASGNTGAVMGTDGTEKNPVDNFANARTLADNLGVQRYYITNRSTFIGASDLTVTHENWEFVGVGDGNSLELDVAGIDVDGSAFFNLDILGSQGGTDDVSFVGCHIGRYIGADGHFSMCGLTDTVFIGSGDDVFFEMCHSMIAGNARPGISFGAGISNLSMRGYSGGIELREMAGTDAASIEGMGQIVINDDCSSAPVTARGLFTLDPGDAGSVVFTRDAVFSRQEADLWIPGVVWGQVADSAFTAGTMGDSAKGWGATAASGGVSDAEMGGIADSVWDKIYADGIAVAGGMGDSLYNPTTDSVIVDVSAAVASGNGLLSHQAAATWGRVAVLSWVETSGSNSSTQAQTALGEATDDHYNGMAIMFIGSSVEANQLRRITNYTGATGVVEWTPAMTGTAADDDTLYIMPWATVSATATIQDTEMGAIADSVWDKIYADAINVAGGIGDSLTDATKETIADAVLDSMEAGDARDIKMKSLVVSNSAGDAVQFTSTGSDGDGLQLLSNGAGHGLRSTGGTLGTGASFLGGAAGGNGLQATATSGIGFEARGGTAGDGFYAIGGATNGDGIQSQGLGTGYAFKIVGATSPFATISDGTDDVLMTSDTASLVDNIWDEDSTGHYTSPQMAFVASQTSASAGVTDLEMAAIADSVWQALLDEHDGVAGSFGDSSKNWKGSGAASGIRTLTLIIIDTSASPDDTLPSIPLEIVNSTSQTYFKGQPTSGIVPVSVDDNDTVLVYARGLPTYNFLGEGGAGTEIGFDSVFIVNGDTTVDVKGYKTSVSAPSSADVCRAYVNLYDQSGNPLPGGQIFVQLSGRDIQDTCNNTTIGAFEMKGTISDADSGFTYIDLIKSKCLLKTGSTTGVEYKIGIDYGDHIDWKFNDTIPDSATFRVTRY